MPINFQQIRSAIQRFAQFTSAQAQLRAQYLETALSQLKLCAQESDWLNQQIEVALSINSDLRCALPTPEPIDQPVEPPISTSTIVLLAADGSQIIPNQHLAVQFGVINVGLMRMSAGHTPQESIESDLLYANDILSDQGYLVGEELIALRRDHKERSYLLQEAVKENEKVITLTDGPLELFREGRESADYQRLLEDYLQILSEMADKDILTAGYVDKPRSDLVIRLLELTLQSQDQIAQKNKIRELPGITDADLFARILQPEQRSAIFKLQSHNARKFSGLLAIHFFYLNIGRVVKPQIARVEFPAWVLQSPQHIDLIHYHLLDQCKIIGAQAYPYILHRAHEVATVSFQEREHLTGLLQHSLLSQGLEPGEKSSKQFHKDSSGKTRYRR
ncbi:MAG TPA: DNA double-strand break repair nuclease NurA [Anaerolineaceae bacterium]|nr:DNA double-strand break repair nuclease NurA [Anaerolineaceae bacterium]